MTERNYFGGIYDNFGHFLIFLAAILKVRKQNLPGDNLVSGLPKLVEVFPQQSEGMYSSNIERADLG